MITQENVHSVVKQLNTKDKKRLKNTNKEYAVLMLWCGNAGCITELILTNDYNRYKNVYKDGNCILEVSDSVFNDIL